MVVDRIRTAMLTALETHCDASCYVLEMTIGVARDVSELWYLRPELMNAISASRSEMVARKALATITSLFAGYHPGAASSRFASL
jgi:hypothetical protein